MDGDYSYILPRAAAGFAQAVAWRLSMRRHYMGSEGVRGDKLVTDGLCYGLPVTPLNPGLLGDLNRGTGEH
eukprot:11209303-Lingulodinium_polyedra.AAC.1